LNEEFTFGEVLNTHQLSVHKFIWQYISFIWDIFNATSG